MQQAFQCVICLNRIGKAYEVCEAQGYKREGYYCESCYNLYIKPMTSIQEQHKLASEWHAEMAAKGSAFEVQAKLKKSDAEWFNVSTPNWQANEYEFRRKPTPKLIPWTFEDITPEIAGAWFRGKGGKAFFSPVGFYIERILIPKPFFYTLSNVSQCGLLYHEAIEQLEYSTDLKTWKPCGKVSE